PEGLVEAGEGLVLLAELREGAALVAPGLRELRVDLEGLLARVERVVGPAELGERVRPVDPGRGVPRVGLDRLIERRERLREAALDAELDPLALERRG